VLTGALELRLHPLMSAPAQARHALAPWLAAIGAKGTAADDALLVVSELVTNGAIHSRDDDILVRADTADDEVFIEVVTRGRDDDGPSRGAAPAGRGMSIVADICRQVVSRNDPSGQRIIICSLKLM
jgi:serine/threonine-protein kinase RsbW